MKDSIYKLRTILLYGFVFSVILTGVFRKWIYPDYANIIAITPQVFSILLCLCLSKDVRFTIWEKSFFVIGIIVFLLTVFIGHGNVMVGLYGCLPYWFGLPTCAILAKITKESDVRRITKILVFTSIVNSILIVLQFYSPIMSFINTSNYINDSVNAEMDIANLAGGFRPSGLFMHNTQTTLLQSLTFGVLLYNIFFRRYIKLRYCLIALALEIIAIPFSISRTNFMFHLGVTAFFVITCFKWHFNTKLIIRTMAAICIIIAGLSTSYGKQAIRTMTQRFVTASEAQYRGESTLMGTVRDIYDRNVKYNIDAIIEPVTQDGDPIPFWGYGQGMSTQVGARLLGITAHSGFSLAEWDGLRIMCESGYLFGWLTLFIRLRYSFVHLFHLGDLRRKNKLLSLALLPSFLLGFFLFTTWGNLIQAHMAYLFAGLFMASLKYDFNTEGNDMAIAEIQEEEEIQNDTVTEEE